MDQVDYTHAVAFLPWEDRVYSQYRHSRNYSGRFSKTDIFQHK